MMLAVSIRISAKSKLAKLGTFDMGTSLKYPTPTIGSLANEAELCWGNRDAGQRRQRSDMLSVRRRRLPTSMSPGTNRLEIDKESPGDLPGSAKDRGR